jgi:hypothetical protein
MFLENGLPTLNYLELICGKLRAYSRRDARSDGEDIIFLLSEVKYTIDRNRISEEQAMYFLENFSWAGDQETKAKVEIALLGGPSAE